jgi:hypothetical protein
MDLARDILAGFGLLTLGLLAIDCVRGWIEAGPPSSHDIRRRPWTEDERDTRRKWDRIQGRH